MQPKASWSVLGAAVALMACALLARALWATPAPAADGSVDARAREIAGVLKCPVCQNISVADSPSELAGQMRDLIHKKLEAGETRDQIIAYFVDRYGQEVLLDPPKTGFNRLLWWGPAAALLGGLVVIGVTLRNWLRGSATRRVADRPLTPGEEAAYLALAAEQQLAAGDGEPIVQPPTAITAASGAATTARIPGSPS